jgi:hypothetical protein
MNSMGAMIFSCAFMVTTGCALHYNDNAKGTEHLWGFGQLRLQREPAGSNFVAIVTGVRAPGLVLEIGKDHFGLTLGYLERQRLELVSEDTSVHLSFPSVSPRIASFGETNAPWACGHLQMRTVPALTHHYAIMTGKSLVGLGANLGKQDNNFGIVMDGRQCAVLLDESIRLDLEQTSRRWPGFNLFTTDVRAAGSDSFNQNNTERKP